MGQFKCITAPINSLKGVPTFLMLMWLSQKILGNSQEEILSCLCEAGPFKDRLDCVESKTQIPLSLHRALLKTNLKKNPRIIYGTTSAPRYKAATTCSAGEKCKVWDSTWERKRPGFQILGENALGAVPAGLSVWRAPKIEQLGCPGSPQHQEISIPPDQIVQNQFSFSWWIVQISQRL